MVEEKENNSLNWIIYILAALILIFIFYLFYSGEDYSPEFMQGFTFGNQDYHISKAFSIAR